MIELLIILSSSIWTYPCLEDSLVALSQLLEAVVSLLLKVWFLLYLCLVEAVDDGVLALGHEDALDLAGVFEADLADFHAAILLQVGPWGIDDCNIVLLVAFGRVLKGAQPGKRSEEVNTFNGVGLCQLSKVHDQLFGKSVPCLTFLHAKVDMCAGEFICVKLTIAGQHCWPLVLTEGRRYLTLHHI